MQSTSMIESPTKRIRPLEEAHGPTNNASNVVEGGRQRQDVGGGASSSPGSMKFSPAAAAPRTPPAAAAGGENRLCAGRECRDDDGDEEEESFRLSPVGRVNFDTPGGCASASETPRHGDEDGDARMESFFPDDTIEIHGPEDAEEGDDEEGEEEEGVEETEEMRARREMEESEALARQLMAEEAMASYAASADYLRENAGEFSEEDLAALQAAMAEEDPDAGHEDDGDDGVNGAEEDDEDADSSRDMSYDALLRLGERIGDVKEERWAMVAGEKIRELPTLQFDMSMAVGREENHTEVKCQVCQYQYEEGDVLRRLPCGHCFHRGCIDEWLATKDTCALCRKSIVE